MSDSPQIPPAIGPDDTVTVGADGSAISASGGVPDAGPDPQAEETPPIPPDERTAQRWAARLALVKEAHTLRAAGMSWRAVAETLRVPMARVYRWVTRWERDGDRALLDAWSNSGRRSRLPALSQADRERFLRLLLRSNRAVDSGSLAAAAKLWAIDPATPEPWRAAVLLAVEYRRALPAPLLRLAARITPAHYAAYRRPGRLASDHLGGEVGARLRDKLDRLRIIEADDGTLNFAAVIPWPAGGDPCSDRYGVRVGRWQWLPMIEAGWSHQVVGYSLVCRPRGSYRAEDIRTLIHTLVTSRGLPDAFRFERGPWEADAVTDLIRRLGVTLHTTWQPNHKSCIEGLFGKAWTHLSMTLPGQLGRYRGEMERENRLIEACRSGRQDPRDHFPVLGEVIAALDGFVAHHNSDRIHSIYGSWIPDVRARELDEVRPWKQLPAELHYLFAPIVRDWTVVKGTVGGRVAMLEDFAVPYYFAHPDLWLWNGHKVRLYFDPLAEPCRATVVSLGRALGARPGEVLFEAELIEYLPAALRAAYGVGSGEARIPEWRRAALSALRRETRAFAGEGRVLQRRSESRDGTMPSADESAAVVARAGGAAIDRSITPREVDYERPRYRDPRLEDEDFAVEYGREKQHHEMERHTT